MPTIKFTANLKRFYPTLTAVHSDALDLHSILEELEGQFKGLRDYVVDEQGQLRKHVNIFIGNELIHDRVKLSDPVQPDDEIYIMQALSGG
ncbi:MoaD/ThiS family protein [Reichenbachiella carrageenanivorans]|uniref:MoaD/ThiS family protein n=1 Tax=Reichenbachiella carrageenanivorans TaxID=2979869 RepID=A0ABY6CVN6_9BACT|nr:MoaD/ThiS family protein [Reichenbachiella carrageenanivorans]UXX77971.1 MoaD/ThiS family protein [Reichenbachiella carrageenanivorans]